MQAQPLLKRCLAITALLPILAVGAWAQATERIIYEFPLAKFGVEPEFAPSFDKAGNLYGVTNFGGAYNHGTAFELTPRGSGVWAPSRIYSFKTAAEQTCCLVVNDDGIAFGITSGGDGINNNGFIFRLAPNPNGRFTETVLYNLKADGSDGSNGWGPMTLDAVGNLYGVTLFGGAYGSGTVFELSHAMSGWNYTVLNNVSNSPNAPGSYPSGGLVLYKGNLYGTTAYGGVYGDGNIFELAHSASGWTYSEIYNFTGASDGYFPSSPLAVDSDGNLYGVADQGGDLSCNGGGGCGTLFKLFPTGSAGWRIKVLHAFEGGTDGAFPDYSPPLVDRFGNVYGTTTSGGDLSCSDPSGCGTVFEWSPVGRRWTILHRFSGPPEDGNLPLSGLVFDSFGNLYGTTLYGGAYAAGTVFEVTP
jgi:uncharacterized repeat protein (TIGR03803 family)